MPRTNWIISLAVICLVSSCGKQSPQSYVLSTPGEVKAFLADKEKKNNYETKIQEVNFKLRHISGEEMALREFGDLPKATQAMFDSAAKAYEGKLYFRLEISIDGFNEELMHYRPDASGSEAAFEERVSYYSFGMQKDICIVVAEKDTIPCTMYHYERNYGVSPNNRFMLGFEASALKNAVLVYDNPYLPTGTVKFALSEQDLSSHPQIKIN